MDFVKTITEYAYSPFNIYGYGTTSPYYVWFGWNTPKVNNQWGFAGVRTNGTIHYAFVYRFKTPSWNGTVKHIAFGFRLNRETTAAANINVSLTRTDPTLSTAYGNSTLPTDSGRMANTTISLNSGDQIYSWEFDTSTLQQNTTYYLVFSPNGGTTNYATISNLAFIAQVTYEAEASGITADDGYIGSTINILMTNDGMTHTIKWSFAGYSGTIAATTAATYSWTVPTSFNGYIPDATSGICTLTCETDAGSTSTQITLFVPDSIKPTIYYKAIAPVNSDPTVSSWGIYLQSYSKIRAALSATASYSTIKSWRIDCGAVVFSEDNVSETTIEIDETSDILVSAGTYKVTVTATDARGRTATFSEFTQFTVHPYSAPSVSNASVYRCLSDGTRDDKEGTYLRAVATKVYSSANGHNSCTMELQYKERSASESSYVTVPLTDNTPVIIGTGSTFDVLKSYNVRIYVEDELGGSYYDVILSTQTVAFNLKPSKESGAGFGGYAQDEKIVELFNGWKLRVPSSEHILVWDGSEVKTLKQLIDAGGGGGGTTNYNDLSNKPSINGVTLSGNKTTSDLNIPTGTTDYNDLTNKPKINGYTLTGNQTAEDLGIEPELYKVTYNSTTIAQIMAAVSDGKLPYLERNGSYYYCIMATNTECDFVRYRNIGLLEMFYITSANGWGYSTSTIPTDTTREAVANKVTSISSSSTDTQYPSAKCVYDLIGDIEEALSELR